MNRPVLRYLALMCGAFCAVSGCAQKPFRLTRTVTVARALEVVEQHTPRFNDFSGRASVRIDGGEGPKSATLQIRYIRPHRFRVYVKGFAGIDLARISALGDSVAVYVPSENICVTASRDSGLLARLVPDLDIDLDGIESLFTGSLPPSSDRESYEASLDHRGHGVVLTLASNDRKYRYSLTGQPLELSAEELVIGNEVIWRKTFDRYGSSGGVLYPEALTIERGGMVVRVTFSQGEVNSGIAEGDLTFSVPPSAERIVFE